MGDQLLINVYVTVHVETLRKFIGSFLPSATPTQVDVCNMGLALVDVAKYKLKEALQDVDTTEELKPFEEYLSVFSSSGMDMESLLEHQSTFDVVGFRATAKNKTEGVTNFQAYKAGIKEVINSVESLDVLKLKYQQHIDASDEKLSAMVEVYFEYLNYLLNQ